MKAQITSKSPANQSHTAVAFYRVSLQNMETDRQKEDVQRYCNAFGWNIIQEFEEKVSGKAELTDRKELQAFMKYVEINKPDYCIVSELSRIGRSNLTLLIIEQLTKMKICFVSLKENLKTLNDDKTINPSTQLLIDILNGINKFELETIKYRVSSGVRKTVNTGTWMGNVPFGYNKEGKQSEARLVINDEAETVKMIFAKFFEGWGTHKIASHLNINNITTKNGVMWKDTSVYKILNNSIYIGKRIFKSEIIEAPELKIVESGLFYQVKERLEKNLNTTELNKHFKYEYSLQNKILCSCGQHFVGQHRFGIYMCKSKKYAGGCDIKNVKIDWLENTIKEHLVLNQTKLIYDNTMLLSKTAELKSELEVLQQDLKAEKRTQNNLLNNIGVLPQNIFQTKYSTSQELEVKLQTKIEEIEKKLEQNKQAETLDAFIDFGTIHIAKDVLQKVIDNIQIDNENIVVTLSNTNTFTITR